MSQPAPLSWIQPQVTVTEADGVTRLENLVPLTDYPANIGVWLRRAAARYSGKIYLAQRNASGAWQGVTYADALARVNRLSNGLLAQGLDGSRPIAILSENSIEMALVQLAAMQIGVPVTPISNAYSVLSQTGGHIRHILDITRAPLLVMSNADTHMAKLAQFDTSAIRLFAVNHAANHAGIEPLDALEAGGDTLSLEGEARFAAVTPATLAKIQFTSGSTSLPKGVEVTHGMMTSNQAGIAQMWPSLGPDDVFVDFLPWNHTFGGNFIANMILMHGGTFYIDGGNPAAGFELMVRNITDVQPTVYFGVPRSYTMLYARMQTDETLRGAFFRRLKFMFTAAAALDQRTFEGMQAMSASVRGAPVPFFAAWGMTETSPDATLVYWPARDARVIGLPIPGVTIKLAASSSGKREIRVKGVCVTRGYYANPEATAQAFDEAGYLRTYDAAAFLDPADPTQGLVFDGRTGEDFKLTSGTWAHNARLRGSVNTIGQPYLLEVVPAAPNRDFLTALIFPNTPALRNRFTEASAQSPDDDAFLASADVRAFFADVFTQHNRHHASSSERFTRCLVLTVPPRLDANETTDKGYINQIAVLRNRAADVERLYQTSPDTDIITLIP
ncbi:MAG TPA: AMP-binding protein [Ktedonobacterales bacterium]